MKYRVIGWASLTDRSYPVHANNTESVVCAVVKEIQEHGYLFGGDAHEDYCPVLNDGTKVSFSWRGWGAVMARAWSHHGDYAYMDFYMNQFLPKEIRCYPKIQVDDTAIVPKQQLRQSFEMHLADGPFFAVKSGKKRVEFRLFDEKRQEVDFGDFITFIRCGHEEERVTLEVKELDLFESFHELARREERRKAMGIEESEEEFIAAMRKYYSEEEEKKYGVLAIGVGLPSHAAKTYACLAGMVLLCDEDVLEEMFGELEFRSRGYYEFGENEEYDVDLNTMVKKTIAPLLGREAEIKKFIEENEIWFDIYVELYLERLSEEPYPILPPDEEVVAFLYESGARLHIEYHIS